MLLVLDNGSVFTQKLVDFLRTLPIDFEHIPASESVYSEIQRYDSYILSGRRKNDPKINVLNSKIIRHAVSNKKPLLGICYGAEILALAMGGSVRRMKNPHIEEEEIEILVPNPLCEGRINVYESHHFEISRLNNSLENIASSSVCKNEIIRIKDSKIFGTQFHPEMSEDGHRLIERFVSL